MRKRDLALKAAAAPVQSSRIRRKETLRKSLSDAREALDLSFDQLGRVFHVSGETVRRWETGAISMPEAYWAIATSLAQDTERLQHLFEPHRLPMVLRRPAEMFAGRTAMDWIFDGRIQETADLYEAALLYQA